GITNLSSGKMGFAMAQAAAEAAANVIVVVGPSAEPTPANVSRIDVRSAAEMADAALSRIDGADIFIAVAAVADYTPQTSHDRKVKKSNEPLTITLKPTIDILATVASRPNPPFCVGFAAESHDVVKQAEEKRRRKKIALLIANRAQDALGYDTNEVTLLDDDGAHPLPKMEKVTLARRLVSEIAVRLRLPRQFRS